jgi:HEAT repeat protein
LNLNKRKRFAVNQDRIDEALVEEPADVPKSSWVLVGQFFIVPIVIVGLCVGVFLLFGALTHDNRSARDYLNEVRAGKSNRWQSAFELSKRITAAGDESSDPSLARDIAAAFRDSRSDDPRVRQYLALALGRLRNPMAVGPLVEALEDSNADVQLYAAWALGELRDRRAVEPLLTTLGSEDPNLRKMVIFSLGALRDPRAQSALHEALDDKQPDIRWNAALALARLQDRSGLPVLHQMLDRTYLSSLAGVTDEQMAEAMINASRGVALLKDVSARDQLRRIGSSDENLKVRAAALNALKRLP